MKNMESVIFWKKYQLILPAKKYINAWATKKNHPNSGKSAKRNRTFYP
jgi:hypothetical protein